MRFEAKRVLMLLVLLWVVIACLCLSWCTDAEIASHNLSKRSDYFEIPRRVVFYNWITNEYILEIEWYCSLQANDSYDHNDWNIAIVCKDWDGYKKHYLWLSDNVTYIIEQLDAQVVSANHYKVVFKPSAIVPSIELR